ncbi:MAG: hypothetical protein H0V89_09050, partial [Deltaproteobacteria bacterium]|nr:hypothetical protein [Deltaproteobacteria bacterium]
MNVRIETMPRPPGDDEALGTALVGLVERAVARGGAPPAAAVVREGEIDLVRLENVPQVPRFVAALSRSTRGELGAPEAVGLVGMFPTRRADGATGPLVAAVFL